MSAVLYYYFSYLGRQILHRPIHYTYTAIPNIYAGDM